MYTYTQNLLLIPTIYLLLPNRRGNTGRCDPNSLCLLLHLLVLLLLRLPLFYFLPLLLALELVRSPDCDVLGFVIAEEELQTLLDEITSDEVARHDGGDHDLEIRGERHEFELLVDLRDELGSAGERDGGDGDETPVHSLVLADGFAEGTTLVVDCEGGDLLDKLKEVDCGVEEGGLEFLLEVRVGVFGFDTLDVLGYVDEGDDVNGELTEDGADDVDVEDVVLGTFFGKGFDGLWFVSMSR